LFRLLKKRRLTVRMNKDQAMELHRSLGKLVYIWRKRKHE